MQRFQNGVHRGDTHEITDEQRIRFEELFRKLDRNKDGRLDIDDLCEGLVQHSQVPSQQGHAEKILEKYDRDRDGQLDFTDFVRYLSEHERKLKLAFHKLDANKDGAIDVNELMMAFKNLGITIDRVEAQEILSKMDKDRTLKIDWTEWREFLQFHNSSNIHDILHFWRHSSIIDIGEDRLVPDDFTEEELKTGMWWRHLVAGGAAGAVSRTCTAPLDRLKVYLQVYGGKDRLGVASGFRTLLAEGGVGALWRGNFMNVIKIAPESAIKFLAYEKIKKVIKGDREEIGVAQRFLAGSTAGAVSQTAIYPMEVMKTRLALGRTGEYRGIWGCACKVFKQEGLRSFYRGYIPNLIGIIPYAGIDLAIYETLKIHYIRSHPQNKDPNVFVLLLCGTTSSTCGQLASYPLALVRTKLQAKASQGGTQDTMLGLFRTIFHNEGVKGLYRGLAPNFMKVAPAVSISYVIYEHVRKALGVSMT